MSRDHYNYASDIRNQPSDPVTVYIDDDEIELPTKWAVCSVCHGEGKHVNPSIDCNGLTADDFAEDPELAENYYAGAYDVDCHRCGGRTTERVVDWDRLTDEQRKAYEQQLEDIARDRAMELAEIRAGA